jgi:ABC-type Mn2+/Zn2+ transport system ATPase subunit
VVRDDHRSAPGIGGTDCAHILVFSRRERIQAVQLTKSTDVVDEVFHPDFGLGPHQTDGSHQRATHVVRLRAENMLDTDTNRRFGPVAFHRLFGQRLAPFALAVDAAGQSSCPELRLYSFRPVGRIRPDPGGGIAAHQQLVHRLTVMMQHAAVEPERRRGKADHLQRRIDLTQLFQKAAIHGVAGAGNEMSFIHQHQIGVANFRRALVHRLNTGKENARVRIPATEPKLVEMMTGRAIAEIYPSIRTSDGPVMLKVENIRSAGVHDCSLHARAGEVLGIAGLVGSGKSRLFRTIMGLARQQHGQVTLLGKDISHAPTRTIIKSGMYYLSPDRKAEGLDLAKTTSENLALNLVMGKCAPSRSGLINWTAVQLESNKIADHVELVPDFRNKLVSQLSGGNQQKVLFGKCFGQDAEIYIFDEPTVGVDMGTRSALCRYNL